MRLLRKNKYKVVAQGEKLFLNPLQKVISDSLIEELNFFLLKKNLITKLLEEKKQEEIMLDELKKILLKYDYTIDDLKSYEGIINGEKVFIRPGSKKAKGWQVTFRDIFKKALENEKGSLLMPRGGILLIPFSEIKKCVTDPKAFSRNTIDIFIAFGEDSVKLLYKNNEIDVTSFQIVK